MRWIAAVLGLLRGAGGADARGQLIPPVAKPLKCPYRFMHDRNLTPHAPDFCLGVIRSGDPERSVARNLFATFLRSFPPC